MNIIHFIVKILLEMSLLLKNEVTLWLFVSRSDTLGVWNFSHLYHSRSNVIIMDDDDKRLCFGFYTFVI
jgi:hypothetical protein